MKQIYELSVEELREAANYCVSGVPGSIQAKLGKIELAKILRHNIYLYCDWAKIPRTKGLSLLAHDSYYYQFMVGAQADGMEWIGSYRTQEDFTRAYCSFGFSIPRDEAGHYSGDAQTVDAVWHQAEGQGVVSVFSAACNDSMIYHYFAPIEPVCVENHNDEN